jgi:hypothetical protein
VNFSRTVTKRSWDGKLGRFWYGRTQESAGKPWRWVKLFADRRASERAWEDRKRAADRVAAGETTAAAERLRTTPLAELLADYHRQMERDGRTPGHVAKSRDNWKRILKWSGWAAWSDIHPANVAALLDKMDAAGATASYKNKILQRVKAFVNAVLPDEVANPLRRVRYVSEKGARRTRGRRAATVEQLHALLTLDGVPAYRRLAWALAALNGFRRNEAAALTIHVPRVETLRAAWRRAGVPFTDDQGRRLDYHALRHTFQTMLDLTGCSRATKKRLMRHATGDVTDGYAHAELREMAAALERLPAPPLPSSSPSTAGTQAVQQSSPHGHAPSFTEGQDIVSTPFPPMALGVHRHASDYETEQFPNDGDTGSITGTDTVPQYATTYKPPVNQQVSHATGHTRDSQVSSNVPHRPAFRGFYWFRGMLLPRVPRPVSTPNADACRVAVARLLAAAAAAAGKGVAGV